MYLHSRQANKYITEYNLHLNRFQKVSFVVIKAVYFFSVNFEMVLPSFISLIPSFRSKPWTFRVDSHIILENFRICRDLPKNNIQCYFGLIYLLK